MLKIRLRYHTIPELMFFAIWTFYSIYYVLLSASYLAASYDEIVSTLSFICRYSAIGLLLISFLIDIFVVKLWSRRQLICYIVLLIIAFVVELRIQDRSLLILILFILTAQAIDFKRLLRYDIKLKMALLFIVLLLCAFGEIVNRTEIINGSFKMALGFAHPNTLACYVSTILVEWLCIRYKKMKWFDWVAIIAVIVAVYGVCKSRTSIFTFLAILILYFIANYWQKIFQTKILRIIMTAVPAFIVFFTFYIIYLYSQGNVFALRLNSILTGRIELSYFALQANRIKLFGQNVTYASFMNKYDNQTVFLIDNTYVRMFLSWGAVFACIIVIVYMIRFFQWSKRGQINFLLMGLFFVILGFGEAYMITVFYNLTLLCLFGIPCTNEDTERKDNLLNISNENSNYFGKHKKLLIL